MQNPIVTLRKKAGLSQREFAAALGLPVGTVVIGEHGNQELPPRRLLDALNTRGIDTQALVREYQQVREAQGRVAMQRLAAAL